MLNDIIPLNPIARPGHNSATATLAELLADDLAADKERAELLAASAADAKITRQADAEKVADLIAMIRASKIAINRICDDHKRPLMADCRLIDASRGQVLAPLGRAQDALKTMLDSWLADNAPINPSIAQIGSRREIEFCIDDLPAVIGWLLKHRGGEIAQAARTIIGKQLRSAGVEYAADAGIPGVTVTIAAKTQIR